MENKNSFIAFLTALIPGVGYMYLGLIKKGVQFLLLFLFLRYLFTFLGIDFMKSIVLWPFWFYTFFDTMNVAEKMKKGITVPDCDLIFEKVNWNDCSGNMPSQRVFFLIIAWSFVFIGSLAILNKMFNDNQFYQLAVSLADEYFFPILLIASGIYLLIKDKVRVD